MTIEESGFDPFGVIAPSKGGPCEVFALKVAEATRPTGLCVFLTDFHIPIDTYFWCVAVGAPGLSRSDRRKSTTTRRRPASPASGSRSSPDTTS